MTTGDRRRAHRRPEMLRRAAGASDRRLFRAAPGPAPEPAGRAGLLFRHPTLAAGHAGSVRSISRRPASTRSGPSAKARGSCSRRGWTPRFERHRRTARAVRAALRGPGLRAVPRRPEFLADTLSVVTYPAGVEDKAFRALYAQNGVVVAGGLGETAGKVFRMGHMGQPDRGRHRLSRSKAWRRRWRPWAMRSPRERAWRPPARPSRRAATSAPGL